MQRFTPIFHRMSQKDVDAFFERCANLIIKQLNPPVVREMKKAKEEGFHTVLLSGGYQRLMEFVGASLGFDTVIGTALNYKDGCVDAAQPLEIVCGDDKTRCLCDTFGSAEVNWKASTAYADSLSDLSILNLVGTPVVVNPDPELKEEAEKAGWRLLIC